MTEKADQLLAARSTVVGWRRRLCLQTEAVRDSFKDLDNSRYEAIGAIVSSITGIPMEVMLPPNDSVCAVTIIYDVTADDDLSRAIEDCIERASSIKPAMTEVMFSGGTVSHQRAAGLLYLECTKLLKALAILHAVIAAELDPE